MSVNTNQLKRLIDWYANQCNGDWEHSYGVLLTTLDNPGWRLRVDLAGTHKEGESFNEVADLEPDDNWYRCWVEDNRFHAAGGIRMLPQMLQTFLDWVDAKPNMVYE
jgi:hypothetical protein